MVQGSLGRSSVRRALLISYVDKYAGIVVGLATSMVVSRLLTPSEIGVFSVAAVIAGYASTFREMGGGTFLVQQQDVSADDVRAVSAISLTLGIVLAIMLALASAPVAQFYDAAELRMVLLVLAGTYLIVPFGSVTYAMLSRAMDFRAMAWINVSSAVVGAAVSIYLAWAGFGPLSLAWGPVASAATSAIVALAFRPAGLPWNLSFRLAKRVLDFSTRSTVASFAAGIASTVPGLIVGRLQGVGAAGYLSRGEAVSNLFFTATLRAVWPVMTPLFAALRRERADLKEPYVRGMLLVTGLGWPFFAFVGIMAAPTIEVLFGPQWTVSAEVLRWLSIASAIGLPFALSGPIMLALGEAKAQMRIQLWFLPIQLAGLALGATFGLVQMAAAMVATITFYAILVYAAIRKHIGVGWHAYATVIRGSAPLGLSVAFPSALALWLTPEDMMPIARLAVAGVPSTVAFAVALATGNHPLRQEIRRVITKSYA